MRALSGAVYVALVLGAAWMGAWATYVLFLGIAILAVLEWHKLYWREGACSYGRLDTVIMAVLGYGLLLPDNDLVEQSTLAPWLCAGLVLVIALKALRAPSPKTALLFGISLVAGIALPMACASWLTHHGAMLFIGFMLLLWTNDTGAYLVGKSIGRNKLMPKVSPGKTWEGLFGGVALTAVVAWFWAGQYAELSRTAWIIAAVVVSVTGTIGDLLESFMKRRAGVKDSGTIMPGHGGVLDRFDGYLLAAPAMVILTWLATR